ncbi:MAG TPA: hypothetical protein VG272_03935 [Candidatus Acidoferrales bacterium]|nr:hypothetical protein [Candidatus Acidoferrales bacterium]
MSVFRTSVKKTGSILVLGAAGLICIVLLQGTSAIAQNKNAAVQTTNMISAQRTEAFIAAHNAVEPPSTNSVAGAPAAAPLLAATPSHSGQAGATTAAPATPQAPAPAEPPPAEEESHEHMMEIPHGPVLKFRGFFDLDFDDGPVAQNLNFPLGVPAKTSFRAGEFDLFISSQIAEKLSFLTELVFSSGPENVFGVDLERFQLTYRYSKYFEISAGRYHTSIGYYNTAFHHGTWFSTATGRPFAFFFEDSGGPLPIHELGVTTTGLVPHTGKINLHWIAEVGNGSSEVGNPLYGDGVENFASDRNHKDVNVAFYIRPEWVEGLQIGASFLTGDLVTSGGTVKVNQTVTSAYAVLIDSRWEFLNEFVLLHHQAAVGGQTFNSPMGYTQLAYHIGKARPYFRWQEVNIPSADPVTTFKGRYEGPSGGIRYDVFTYAALKFQYNRVYFRNAAAENGVELQLAFTF